MDNKIKLFLKDRFVYIPLVAGLALWLIALAVFYFDLSQYKKNIIIHLNYAGEVDFLSDRGGIILILIFLLVTIVINALISWSLYPREKILSYVVCSSLVWISLLGMIFIYSLTVIN
ncbi:MAG: hypothetical protein WC705_00635 [Candidatus Paceibacterota bacterium]|jgi:hypothetical protein